MTLQLSAYLNLNMNLNNFCIFLCGKPALVDLCAYSSAEGGGTPFLLGTTDEMDTFIGGVNEETLQNTLKYGVGYLHEGLSDLDQMWP